MTGDPLRPWKTAGVVATAVIVLAIPLSVVKHNLDLSAAAHGTGAATFVGRDACAACHEQATESWRGSDHDNAMDVADESTVRGDFDDAVFDDGEISARFFRRSGKFFVNTAGPDGEADDYEVAYTFGVEPLQQYLIPFPGGRLQCLTIAWDTERDEWFNLYAGRQIPADDWLHWTRGAQTWNGMCAECHSTNLKKGYDPESQTFATTWSEIDVSCEACHGPGSRHVEWAELPPMARPESAGYELVVSTADVSSGELVDLCAPCHSRRTELGDYDHSGGTLLHSQVPALLDEGLYFADGQILEEVYVYGSFLQSKMFANDVRCSDCHDVHSLKLVAEGNQLCLQCHRADAYDSAGHHFHKKVHEGKPSAGALCVKCHMVERPYMVVDWRADHSLRLPRPDLEAEIGVPNACSQPGCHGDKPLSWVLESYRKWYGTATKPHYGTILAAGRAGSSEAVEPLVRLAGDTLYPAIVRATALSLLRSFADPAAEKAFQIALMDEQPLLRYTAILDVVPATPENLVELVAPLLGDPVRGVRIQAAARLAGTPDELLEPYQVSALSEALAEYREAMEYSLDFSFAGFNLGNVYSRLGDAATAESYYRTAIEIDDLFAPAKANLATLLNAQGRNDEAEALLRQASEAYPENPDLAYSLGLLLAEVQRYEEAAEQLERVVELAPEHGRAHYNLGLVLQVLGRIKEAGDSLARAVTVAPDEPRFQHALIDNLMRRGDLQTARQLALRLAAEHPDYPAAQQIVAAITQMTGGGRDDR